MRLGLGVGGDPFSEMYLESLIETFDVIGAEIMGWDWSMRRGNENSTKILMSPVSQPWAQK